MGEKNPAQYAFDHGHEGGSSSNFDIDAQLVHNDPSILFEEVSYTLLLGPRSVYSDSVRRRLLQSNTMLYYISEI